MHSKHSLIPVDSLYESGRVPRAPLRDWAAKLLTQLAALGSEPVAWPYFAGGVNNAALIEVFRGDLQNAQEMCEIQLRWISRLLHAHGVLAAGNLAVQPWVNLGRLCRIRGDDEGALQRFALLVDTLAGVPLRIGPVTFDAAAWRELVHTKVMLPELRAVYVVESVKTYLAARDNTGAAEFLRRAREFMDETQPFTLLDEMEFQVFAKLERLGDAMAVLDRGTWNESAYGKLLRFTYRVALHAVGGDREQSRRAVTEIAGRLIRSSVFHEPTDPCILRYLDYLAGLARWLELDAVAAQIWRLGLRAARHLDDIPCCLACLEALIALGGIEDREALLAERAVILRECLYVNLLKPRGIDVDPAALASPVFTALHDRIRVIAEEDSAISKAEAVALAPSTGY
jgi:hypothetical protein